MPTTDPLKLRRTLSEAEGYLELGMTDHALRGLQRRGKLVHGDARGCYLLGESLRELCRYREAIIPLCRSAALAPDDLHVWLALGWCYKRTGQLLRAIAALERALAFAPDEPLLHYNLACYWSLASDRRRALGYLATALRMDDHYRELVDDEEDFEPIRDDPGFKMLTGMIV